MKNLVTLTLVVVWFAILGSLGLGMVNPELFTDGGRHIVEGYSYINNLVAILCITVPIGTIAVVTLVSFVWHKETELKRFRDTVKV